MANNTIQIKRSSTVASPPILANGELAYSSAIHVLYIGSPTATNTPIPIGGIRSPGTLTANQAIVVDASSFIDTIKVSGQATMNVIVANGALGTAGRVLTSNATGGIFWSTPSASATASGSDTQVQFNDGGTAFGATAGFTFNKVTNNISVGNTLIVPTVNATSNLAVGLYGTTNGVNIQNTAILVGNTAAYANLTFGVLSIVNATSTANLTPLALTIGTAVANSTGFVVGPFGVTNGTNITTTSILTGNSTANATHAYNLIQVTNATSTANLTPLALTIGTLLANSTFVNLGTVGTTNGTSIGVSTFSIGNSTANVTATGATLTSDYVNVRRDLAVSGNLSVTGALVTIDVSNINIRDPLIKLAKDNTTTADNIDIGLYGVYTNTTAGYFTALYRDNTSKNWKLVDSIASGSEPTTTVTGGTQALLQAYINAGGLISNSTVVNITATPSISSAIVANTLSLTTALPATSGGTGLNTYAAGDIAYAGSLNPTALTKLTIPASAANGQVLQIKNNLPAYDTLDGGTF